jgi:hypothetical protein
MVLWATVRGLEKIKNNKNSSIDYACLILAIPSIAFSYAIKV